MQQRRHRPRRRAKPDEALTAEGNGQATAARPAQLPVYAHGQGVAPLLPLRNEAATDATAEPESEPEREETHSAKGAESMDGAPALNASGTGERREAVAYGLKLRGRTNASFSSNFQTLNVQVTAGRGCRGCAGSACVHAVGTLESTFTVATTITLPSVADFPDLTPCQRERVQTAIDNVLAPHEQQHVTAFHQYNGTVQMPFDLTLCRNTFDARIQALHNSVDNTRQDAARAASAALDPFEFEVDLNCEDRPKGS